ncbi:MAG: hypothetical protein Q8M96_23495, partial [Rubrivivax sp.]|nr:hypothetical protein [Rubrivivax sp.]
RSRPGLAGASPGPAARAGLKHTSRTPQLLFPMMARKLLLGLSTNPLVLLLTVVIVFPAASTGLPSLVHQ